MRKVLLRFLCYALAVFGVMTLLVFVALRVPGGLRFDVMASAVTVRTSEFSPVEIMQNLLLVAATSMLVFVAWRDRLRRPMAATLGGLMFACLIRELDFFLDFYVVDNLW